MSISSILNVSFNFSLPVRVSRFLVNFKPEKKMLVLPEGRVLGSFQNKHDSKLRLYSVYLDLQIIQSKTNLNTLLRRRFRRRLKEKYVGPPLKKLFCSLKPMLLVSHSFRQLSKT